MLQAEKLTEDVHQSQNQSCNVDNYQKKVAAVAEDDLCVLGQAKIKYQDTRLHQSQCWIL